MCNRFPTPALPQSNLDDLLTELMETERAQIHQIARQYGRSVAEVVSDIAIRVLDGDFDPARGSLAAFVFGWLRAEYGHPEGDREDAANTLHRAHVPASDNGEPDQDFIDAHVHPAYEDTSPTLSAAIAAVPETSLFGLTIGDIAATVGLCERQAENRLDELIEKVSATRERGEEISLDILQGPDAMQRLFGRRHAQRKPKQRPDDDRQANLF